QELPKPITKLTWDNAVLVSPATAERLKAGGFPSAQGGEHGNITSRLVELRYGGRTVRGALLVVVGHPDDCATVHLGYGRRRAGHLGTGAGFDANAIRTSDAPWFGGGLDIVSTGDTFSLACTQFHHLMPGREQHAGRRQESGAARARDALDSRRYLLPRAGGQSRNVLSAGAVHAVRERAL